MFYRIHGIIYEKALLKFYKNVEGLYNLDSEDEGRMFFRNTDILRWDKLSISWAE
jgi:hypothetical protein